MKQTKRPDFNETKKKLLEDPTFILSHMFLDDFCSKIDMDSEEVKAITESDEWALGMTVNGVTVDGIKMNDFLDKLWESNYESMVMKEAKKMMNKKWDETFGGIQEFTEKALTILNDKLRYDWE